jgi:hypothetical protein
MRKYIFIIILSLFALSGCKKDPSYTQKQITAFFTLSGSFQVYSNDDVIEAVLSFRTRYTAPQLLSGKDVYAHGECAFSDANYAIPDQGYVSCYYALSDNADEIFLYYKGGSNNKELMRSYKMTILDSDNIHFTDGGRVLDFERVD